MLKLNLGCGQDIRLGYINIDLSVNDPRVINGDFRNLDTITNGTGQKIDNGSVEEIVCIHSLQYINADGLQPILENWKNKLAVGGSLWLQSYDYDVLANAIVYDRVDIIGLNKMIFGENSNIPHRGIYSLPNIVSVLQALGFKILEKDYQGYEFSIRAIKTK